MFVVLAAFIIQVLACIELLMHLSLAWVKKQKGLEDVAHFVPAFMQGVLFLGYFVGVAFVSQRLKSSVKQLSYTLLALGLTFLSASILHHFHVPSPIIFCFVVLGAFLYGCGVGPVPFGLAQEVFPSELLPALSPLTLALR